MRRISGFLNPDQTPRGATSPLLIIGLSVIWGSAVFTVSAGARPATVAAALLVFAYAIGGQPELVMNRRVTAIDARWQRSRLPRLQQAFGRWVARLYRWTAVALTVAGTVVFASGYIGYSLFGWRALALAATAAFLAAIAGLILCASALFGDRIDSWHRRRHAVSDAVLVRPLTLAAVWRLNTSGPSFQAIRLGLLVMATVLTMIAA